MPSITESPCEVHHPPRKYNNKISQYKYRFVVVIQQSKHLSLPAHTHICKVPVPGLHSKMHCQALRYIRRVEAQRRNGELAVIEVSID